MANILPLPANDPIATPRKQGIPAGQRDPDEGKCTDAWQRWLLAQAQTNEASQVRTQVVQLTGQAGSIGATSLVPGGSSTGLYEVSYYTRVTQAAGVSSSLTVTIGWTDHTIALTLSGGALTGNSTSTLQTFSRLFFCDGNTPITYSTTYASNGAPVMQYELYVVLQEVAL